MGRGSGRVSRLYRQICFIISNTYLRDLVPSKLTGFVILNYPAIKTQYFPIEMDITLASALIPII